MAVRIRDLARRAGTSPASVSLVMNNKWGKKVRPEVAEKVRRLAGRYGYASSPIGRGLVLGRHFRIAVCVKGLLTEHPIIGTFSFHDILSRIAAVASRAGYSLDIIQVDPSLKNASSLPAGDFAGNNDGVLFVGWDAPSARSLLKHLKLSVPYVVVDADLKDRALSYACTDMCKSTKAAVSYLLRRGHRRIAFVRSEMSRARFLDKLKGYKQVLSGNRIGMDESLIIDDMRLSVFERGYRAAERLLSLKKRVTAVFCSDNMCALGLTSCLRERGVRVPEDMEIIGFGDKALADICMPALSYIRRPVGEMAMACTGRILRWIEKEEKFKPVQMRFEEELVLQQSTVRIT